VHRNNFGWMHFLLLPVTKVGASISQTQVWWAEVEQQLTAWMYCNAAIITSH